MTRGVRAGWPAGAGRATAHVLAGLGLVAGGWAVTVAVIGLWFAAVYSLLTGPSGAAALIALYVVVALVGWVPLVWWLRFSVRVTVSGSGACSGSRFHGPAGSGGSSAITCWRC